MNITAKTLLEAIEGNLFKADAAPSRWGRLPEIILSINRQEFARVRCLQMEIPRTWADENEPIVHVRSSDRLPGGFDVKCENANEATIIAAAMARRIGDAYSRVFAELAS